MTTRDPSAHPPARPLRDRLTRVRRAVLRRRRLLAALCVAGSVFAGLRTVAPPPAETDTVLVAARDLPAGTVLTADDLTERDVPRGSAPEAALADPVGGTLAAPVRAGEPVTDVRLVGPGLAATDSGTTAVPLRVSDAAQAALLEAGDRIDLLATDPRDGTATEVADDALVLAVPPPAETDGGALSGRVVVLGVPDHAVDEVTAAAVTAFVTFAWSPH